jgi:hypothetical protein
MPALSQPTWKANIAKALKYRQWLIATNRSQLPNLQRITANTQLLANLLAISKDDKALKVRLQFYWPEIANIWPGQWQSLKATTYLELFKD